MSWIKRNLALFISGVIAIGLLAFGGFYLWSAVQKNAAIDEEINQAKADLDRLLSMDPFPSPTNVDQARKELERMTAFIAENKKLFPPTPPPAAPLNNQTFASLLRNTVAELTELARSSGTRIETNYYFSFEAQRLPVNFPPESLLPLSDRLGEVQDLSTVLFRAKINHLERIRRASVPGESRAGHEANYLPEMAYLNTETGMQLWPYEFTFQSFSPELATVLDGIARLPSMVVVKSIVVEPAESMREMQREQREQGRGAGNVRTNRAPAVETILNERALRITLKLDVIKPAR